MALRAGALEAISHPRKLVGQRIDDPVILPGNRFGWRLKFLGELAKGDIALLHLDTDTYSSTKVEVEHFYPKLV